MSVEPDDQPDRPKELAYSASRMGRALILAGVSPDQAYLLAARIGIELEGSDRPEGSPNDLFSIARAIVGAPDARRALSQLESLETLQAVDLPIIVLIGGTTGTGKSTIATELAHRLGITRVSSTDFIRQTLRAVFARGFMSSIHYSSFDAGRAVEAETGFDRLLTGFVEQSRHVCVGVDAAVSRALTERWSMVLEGVHLVPGLYPTGLDEAIVVPVVVQVSDPELHHRCFHERSVATGGLRPKQKYLDRFDEIRRIQSHIVARANREGVTVVENTDLNRTIDQIIELVLVSAKASRSARA
jgi:2-phosphoglycerate kinase